MELTIVPTSFDVFLTLHHRIIVLNNGLRALLIADVEADPEISTSSESGGAANEKKPTASVVKPSKQNAKVR